MVMIYLPIYRYIALRSRALYNSTHVVFIYHFCDGCFSYLLDFIWSVVGV